VNIEQEEAIKNKEHSQVNSQTSKMMSELGPSLSDTLTKSQPTTPLLRNQGGDSPGRSCRRPIDPVPAHGTATSLRVRIRFRPRTRPSSQLHRPHPKTVVHSVWTTRTPAKVEGADAGAPGKPIWHFQQNQTGAMNTDVEAIPRVPCGQFFR